MRVRCLVPAIALLAAACATSPDTPLAPASPLIAEGEFLARVHCAECHAIGRAGASKHPEAIPFRRMSERFEIEGLEESLAEGIMVGHPEMPEFRFRPEDAQALTAYIAAIQNTP